MLCGFQSNLRYNTSTIFVLLRSINKALCMYILDWNCFHNNVSSFQSLPFSRSFREIRSEGKWVPYSAYMQENKEKAFSECASVTLIPWACKTYSLGYSMWQMCRAENSLKTKIWGKGVSGNILRNWKKRVLL